MKIYFYYNGKKSLKRETINARNSRDIIRRVKKRCKELDLTHVQAKIYINTPFGGAFVAYPVYNVKPLSRLKRTDLETEHLAAYNIHRDKAK